MYLGQRLVIPGAIFGSLFLALLLYALTSFLNYPALAAGASSAQQNQSAELAATQTQQAVIQSLSQEGAAASDAVAITQGGCRVSPQFPEKVRQWCDLITHYAENRGLPPDLVAAVIYQESGGNPSAYSKSGAVGLMQVMPSDGISASFMCVNGPCFANRPSTEKLQDPEFNISYGTKMLAGLVNKHGNYRDALKAYGPMDVGYYYADIVLGLYERFKE